MASGTINIFLTSGQVISVFDLTSEAVGAEKRCNIQGTAITTSPYTCMVASPGSIKDFVVLTSVDGEFEIIANGSRTGVKCPVHAGFAIGVDRTRMGKPSYTFRPGVVYGFRQTVVRSA